MPIVRRSSSPIVACPAPWNSVPSTPLSRSLVPNSASQIGKVRLKLRVA